MNLKNWIARGIEKGATAIIIVIDMECIPYEEYPVYIYNDENPNHQAKLLSLSEGKQKVKSIINLRDEK